MGFPYDLLLYLVSGIFELQYVNNRVIDDHHILCNSTCGTTFLQELIVRLKLCKKNLMKQAIRRERRRQSHALTESS